MGNYTKPLQWVSLDPLAAKQDGKRDKNGKRNLATLIILGTQPFNVQAN